MSKEKRFLSEIIGQRIFILRGQRVMLSLHLAELYAVEPRTLIQAVKRNIERFPKDFMFQLSKEEYDNLKSQIVISSWGGSRRAAPYAFTEQGIAMLSTVLNSKSAVHVNIQIMRTFVKIREYLSTHKELAEKLKELESKFAGHEEQIRDIIEAINQLLTPPAAPKRKIGFEVREKSVGYKARRN